MPPLDLISVSDQLSERLKRLRFREPVSHVYDPTGYAREPLALYFARYGLPPKKAVFVGMNPGPWGMLQTGIPFGEVSFVRDWMSIEGEVGQPEELHPKRPVDGFDCPRSEVSGSRVWGWAKRRFGTAREFFGDFFIINYCPLAFFDNSGKNITPDNLKKSDRVELYAYCDEALKDSVRILKPEFVVGVGRFAFDRALVALDGMDVKVGKVTHPSPANPAANRGWEELVNRELAELGVEIPLDISG